MANNPINFSNEMRAKIKPYVRVYDPHRQSVAGFVQECVQGILDMIEAPPAERRTPAIVLKVDAAFQALGDCEKRGVVIAAKNIVGQVARDKLSEIQPPPTHEAGGQSVPKFQPSRDAVPGKAKKGSPKHRGES